MDQAILIRKLTSDDALQYRQLRLFALKEAPLSFTESYDELADLDEADYVKRLEAHTGFGAFADGEMIGIMGYFIRPHRKQRHQAVLVGVYVHPDWRGKGISSQLLNMLLEDAKQHVEMIILQVAIENFSARHAYLKAGFQSYGVEPKALKLDDRYVDEEMMWLDLAQYQSQTP